MASSTLPQTAVLVCLRAAIFLSSRRYILRRIYTSRSTADSLPLEPLPSPVSVITQAERDKRVNGHEPAYASFASHTFAASFSECCMLFLLLFLQAVDIFSSRTRLLNWNCSLFALLALVLVLIPLLFGLLALPGPRPGITLPRLLSSAIPVGVYLLLVFSVRLPVAAAEYDFKTATVSRLVVLGMYILGVLAGFGAASSVWTYLRFGEFVHPPTEQELVSADASLSAIRDDIQRRREEAPRRREPADGSSTPSWLSRMMPTFQPDEDGQVLAGLHALEHEMSIRIDTLHQRRKDAHYFRTWPGRATAWLGRVFGLYCAFRIVGTILTTLLPFFFAGSTSSANNTDIAAHLIATILPSIPDPARLARHANLILVGIIILLSLHRVVHAVAWVLRVTSRTLGASLLVLVLAWVMNVYLLATIVQLRSSFPPLPSSSQDNNNLLASIPPFAVFGVVFDTSFSIAAMLAILVRWISSKYTSVGR